MSEEEARKRLARRYDELVSTEKSLHDGIAELQDSLAKILAEPKWKFKAEQSGLISRASQAAANVAGLHRELAELLLVGGHDPKALPQTFEALEGKFVQDYTTFQLLASHATLILQKLSGGQVRGDSAVGSGYSQGGLAGHAAEAQELLARPTLRFMRYQLYLEEMAGDAERGGDAELAASLRSGLDTVKRIGVEINEGVRRLQRRERVRLIAQRVRAVPDGISIESPGREFIMDNDKFIEEGREGYRHLYLFSDAVLVVKCSSSISAKLMGHDSDLKFKRLISLRSMTEATCPEMHEPPEASPSTSIKSSLPSFSIVQVGANGKSERATFFGRREIIKEWVSRIKQAVGELQNAKAPVAAWKLASRSSEPPMEDLAALDLSSPNGNWVQVDDDGQKSYHL